MSKTVKHKISKYRKSNHGNTYKLCGCTQCRYGRYSFKEHIKRLQKRIRTYWKQGKEVTLGLYTD
jgi:hypothetical protein